MKTNIKNFKLRKLHVKKTGVYLEFTIKVHEGAEVHDITSKNDYAFEPHADLTDTLAKYKPMIASVFYYDKLKKEDSAEILSKMSVKSITLSGDDKTRGVLIGGEVRSINNRPLVLNTENIRYNSTKYGFEDSFEELEEALVKEAYAFAFEDKKAQLSMFTNEEQDGGIDNDDEFDDETEQVTQDDRNQSIAEG